MTTKTDKQRIVALQRALKIAREALISIQCSGRSDQIEAALDAINNLDWNSKPTPLAGLLGHDRSARR